MLYRMLYTVCRMLYAICCMSQLYAVPYAVRGTPARCPLPTVRLHAVRCMQSAARYMPALPDGTRWPRSIGSLIHSLGTFRLIMSRSLTGIGKHISYCD